MSRTIHIKNFIILCMMLLCLIGTSGCTLELPTPESLITAPETNQELMQQKQMIAQFLTKEEQMIVPEENEQGAAYQYVNLDKDSENEMVVFYANKESNFILGFMILDQRDDAWELLYKTTAYGTDIHYFSVQDLDQDNTLEFLLGVKTGYGSMKELYVYHLTDKELVDITSEDRIAYDRLILADSQDNQQLLITARTDTTVLVGSSNITFYEYSNQNVYPIYDETFEGYCSEMYFARVSSDTEGLYMAMRYNHYINLLLLCKTEDSYSIALEHSIPYDYEEMDGVAIFNDINHDGILEINSLWSPENNLSGRPYADYVHVWLQWDGADGLQAVNAILSDRVNGYHFSIPLAWMDTLYYDFYTEDEISWTEFYYITENRSIETAFALAAVDQLIWDAVARDVADTVVVLGNNPTLKKVYIANIYHEEFNGFMVNAEKLSSCLQIEGGE